MIDISKELTKRANFDNLFVLSLSSSVCSYTEFIKPGASIDSRHLGQDKRNILNILLSCPKMPRLHARSRLYEFGVFLLHYCSTERAARSGRGGARGA